MLRPRTGALRRAHPTGSAVGIGLERFGVVLVKGFNAGEAGRGAAVLAKAMSELETIQTVLEKAARRRRLARALRGLWQGLLVGAILSLLALSAYHLFPLPLGSLVIAALLPLPAMGIGFVIGGWRQPHLAEVARWVDSRQHLKERLSTALEVSGATDETHWRGLVLADAAEHA